MTRTRRAVSITILASMAVTAAVVAVVVASTGGDERPRAAVGRTVMLDRLVPGGASTLREVRQPWGVLLANVAFADDAAGFRAPAGGRFVRVTVARTPVATDRFYLPSTTARPDRSTLPLAKVSVRDGAREFPVRFAGRVARYVLAGIDPLSDPAVEGREQGVSAMVALPDRAAGLRVKVEYDGIAQTVAFDRPGGRPVPVALAHLGTGLDDRAVTSPPVWSPGGRLLAGRAVLRVAQSQLVPYLVGRGWAPAGHCWWTGVLDAAAPGRLRTSGGSYALGRPSTSTGFRTLGAPLVSPDAGLTRDGGVSGLPVVPGERIVALVRTQAQTVGIRVDFPVRAASAAAPRRSYVTAAWTVPLR